ncbi:MAG: IPT/TIG domain-containing protein [Bifidobacteriaceae bacterium]|jgi:hypothetical protein|nr:IPT/TIG domain-containing protein [Bifidobacteriaceae bacterium]
MKYKIILALAILTTISVSAYALNNLTPSATDQNCITPYETVEGQQPLQLCIQESIPTAVTTAGGKIQVFGTNLPYSSTSDYYDGGHLKVQYDAINNVGDGDLNHSTSTSTWKNIAQSRSTESGADDLIKQGSENGWNSTGWVAKNGTYWQTANNVVNFPTGTAARTTEMIFKTSESLSMTSLGNMELAKYGTTSKGRQWGQRYSDYSSNDLGFMAMNGHYLDIRFGNLYENMSDYYTNNKLINFGISFSNNEVTKDTFKVFSNGNQISPNQIEFKITDSYTNIINTNPESKFIFGNSGKDDGYTLYAYRVYDSVLSSAQIKQNYLADKNRFLSLPTATIDNQPCNNFMLISKESFTCTVPASLTPGAHDIKITYEGQTAILENGIQIQDPSISTVSPSVGPSGGGQRITIYGQNFPYAPASNYAEGASAHYDAIDNLGLGDFYHSDTTTTWKNLASNVDNLFLQGTPTGGGWSSNGFLVKNNAYWSTVSNVQNFPLGGSDRTAELVFKTGPSVPTSNIYIADYGGTAGRGQQFGQRYSIGSTNSFYLLNGHFLDVSTYAGSYYNNNLYTPNNFNSFAVAFHGPTVDQNNFFGYTNGEKIQTSSLRYLNSSTASGYVSETNTQATNFTFGARNNADSTSISNNFSLYAYRIYPRQLTAKEVAQNAYNDKIRFTDVPEVKIANNTCANVVVISQTALQCTTPSGTANTYAEVKATINGKQITISADSHYYKYAAAGETYVTSISPAAGPTFGGTFLTLTGENIGSDKVGSVLIGSNPCILSGIANVSQNATQIVCKVPARGTAGGNTADIKLLNLSDETVLTIQNGFNYGSRPV